MNLKLFKSQHFVFIFLLTSFFIACTPKVEVAMSDKPITINLNVKVEHEIRVAVDKELDTLFENEEGLF